MCAYNTQYHWLYLTVVLQMNIASPFYHAILRFPKYITAIFEVLFQIRVNSYMEPEYNAYLHQHLSIYHLLLRHQQHLLQLPTLLLRFLKSPYLLLLKHLLLLPPLLFILLCLLLRCLGLLQLLL